MPFTLAHPAAILPLKWVKRSWFSATGLVVGSMAPDYEYFLQQQPTPTISETGLGIFFFNLPLAILVALVYHLLVKQPLIRHLPQPYDRRLSGFAEVTFLNYLGRHWFIFSSSLLLGMGSHILLDWCTNPANGPLANTFFTKAIPLGPIRERPLILAERFFDGVGTLALLLLVLGMRNPLPQFRAAATRHKFLYWSLALLTLLAITGWEWKEAGGFSGFGKTITVLIWAAVCGLVVASVLMRWFKPQRG